MGNLLRISPETPEEIMQQILSLDVTDPENTRMDVSVRAFMFLASGKADALTGRHINSTDSLEELIGRADEIVQEDLYTLRRPT